MISLVERNLSMQTTFSIQAPGRQICRLLATNWLFYPLQRKYVSDEYLYGSIENAVIGACIKMAHFQAVENFIQINDIVNFARRRSASIPAARALIRAFCQPSRGAAAVAVTPCRPDNP
jgi:hypothetical protein